MTALQGNRALAAVTLAAALALPVQASADQMPTEVWLQADPQPGSVGQPVTFTATVRADSGTLRGTVEFREGDEVIGSVDLSGLEPGPGIIAAGGSHACSVTATGGLMCWGHNNSGQLGDGTTTTRFSPVPVQGLPGAVRAVAAGGSHTCAITVDDTLWCWGSNGHGRLGDGTEGGVRTLPVAVQGLPGRVQAVGLGVAHSCALTDAGEAWCWGHNGSGRLGDGTTTDRSLPVQVQGLGLGVREITGSYSHTCALDALGEAWCWGRNHRGQIGDGTLADRLTPVRVQALGRQNQRIDTHGDHVCVLNRHGRAFCWGSADNGRLGDGTESGIRWRPVLVHGMPRGMLEITTGYLHTCAINRHQRSFCWGSNYAGQLGDGTTNDSSIPVRARTGRVPTGVMATGGGFNCLLTAGGGINCWGSNFSGNLGDGTGVDRPLPVSVLGGAFAPAEGRGIAELVTDELPRGRRCITAHYLGSDDHAPSASGERCLRITP